MAVRIDGADPQGIEHLGARQHNALDHAVDGSPHRRKVDHSCSCNLGARMDADRGFGNEPQLPSEPQ